MFQFLYKVISRLLGFACTAITLIPFFMGTNTFNSFLSQLKLTEGQFIAVAIAILLIILVVCFVQHLLTGKKAKKCGNEFDNFHEKLLASVFEMRKKNTSPPEYATHTAFYGFTKLRCQELCDHIATFLKNKYNKEFSVCIKMIDKRSIQKANRSGRIGEAEVYTFCRAGQSQSDREKSEKNRAAVPIHSDEHFCVPIKDNSDFYTILSDDENNRSTSLFACSNLRMNARLSDILGRPAYRNSTPKYWKYYKSTVVVPIRVEKSMLTRKKMKH